MQPVDDNRSDVPTGQTAFASGDVQPRHADFQQVSTTPDGYSIWRVVYGLDFAGGLEGQSEDVEHQILGPDQSGSIDSAGTFTGSLDGTHGGFAYQSQGRQNSDGSFVQDFEILSHTGFGDLAGISGHFTVVASRDHCAATDTLESCLMVVSYTLTYRLPAN